MIMTGFRKSRLLNEHVCYCLKHRSSIVFLNTVEEIIHDCGKHDIIVYSEWSSKVLARNRLELLVYRNVYSRTIMIYAFKKSG